MKTLVRVIQFGFLAFFVHFGDHTIFAQQKPRTEFFKSDQVDSFDEINEKLMKINEDNCGIKVKLALQLVEICLIFFWQTIYMYFPACW